MQRLHPSYSSEAQAILPLLKDFSKLWAQMSDSERRGILKTMFRSLYFDVDGNLKRVNANSPFDRLLGLAGEDL